MFEKHQCFPWACPLALSLPLSTSLTNSHFSCSLPLQCSRHPCEIYCAPLASQTHTEQLRKRQRLPRRQLRNASHYFVLQAEHLICGEVLALTNNTGASCCALHCITLFDIIPLEISICGIMNTDCFAIGVISVSDASQLLKSEKSEAQLN